MDTNIYLITPQIAAMQFQSLSLVCGNRGTSTDVKNKYCMVSNPWYTDLLTFDVGLNLELTDALPPIKINNQTL